MNGDRIIGHIDFLGYLRCESCRGPKDEPLLAKDASDDETHCDFCGKPVMTENGAAS